MLRSVTFVVPLDLDCDGEAATTPRDMMTVGEIDKLDGHPIIEQESANNLHATGNNESAAPSTPSTHSHRSRCCIILQSEPSRQAGRM